MLKYGRLTVIKDGPRTSDSRRRHQSVCQCDCGRQVLVRTENLKSGNTHSCGCFNREQMVRNGLATRRHGHGAPGKHTPTYETWLVMRSRCRNEKNIGFKYYGGRGISVCARWDLFENFLEDMGERPAGHTLDRKHNDGNYEKKNCRWATYKQQAMNRRKAA